MFFADISVQSASWVDFFLIIAVFVAVVAVIVCILSVPLVPTETRFLWMTLFAWAALTSAGLLFQ